MKPKDKNTSLLKIFGISITLFSLLLLWFFLKPNEEIDNRLLNPNNIDSIHLRKSNSSVTIKSKNEIYSICNQLQKSRLVRPDRININTGFIDLVFFIQNKPILIRIIYNRYNGTIIRANDSFYKNDSLNAIVLTLMNK